MKIQDDEVEWEDPDGCVGNILVGDALDPEEFYLHEDTIAMLEVKESRAGATTGVFLDKDQARELIRILMRVVNT